MTQYDLEQVLEDTPFLDLPQLIGTLATLQAKAQVRLWHRESEAHSIPHEDHYLSVEEVAARFHVKPRWIYRHKRQMPHSQPSRKVLIFPEQAITKWFASRKGT